MYPLVSILTVVYDGESHLEQTIQSVISQDYPNFEYVIIDGGSTDGTHDIVAKYRERIDNYVSEPDHGIYDAINKGIGKCLGQIIKIQNADDLLLPGAVTAAMAELEDYDLDKPVLLIGNSQVITESGAVVGSITEKAFIYGFDSFNHPGWFASASVYRDFGLYSEAYRIASDYEYYLRFKTGGGRILRIAQKVAAYRQNGASAGMTGVWEVASINRKYLGLFWTAVIGTQHLMGKILRPIVRRFRCVMNGINR